MYINPYKYITCCSPKTSSNGCPVRLSGECVYYSGSTIVGPSIIAGDDFNTVVNKLAEYINTFPSSITASNGLTKVSPNDIQLGQIIGQSGNPASLSSNREIPLNTRNIVFTGTGNIGINTSSPTMPLHVVGRSFPSGAAIFGSDLGFFSPYVQVHEPLINYTSGTISTARGVSLFVNKESSFDPGLTLPNDYYALNVYNTFRADTSLALESHQSANSCAVQVGNFFRRRAGFSGTATITSATDPREAYTAIQARNSTAPSIICNGYYSAVTAVVSGSGGFMEHGIGLLVNSGNLTGNTVVQNLYGVYISSPIFETGGSATNMFGIYQEDSTTKNYFNGLTAFGSNVFISSAKVQITSTTQGFLPPRMTTAQKNAIVSPVAGLMVYDTNLNKLCVYTTAWETITSS